MCYQNPNNYVHKDGDFASSITIKIWQLSPFNDRNLNHEKVIKKILERTVYMEEFNNHGTKDASNGWFMLQTKNIYNIKILGY